MKQVIIYFLLCLITIGVKAQEVDAQLARKVAENYFDRETHDSIKANHRLITGKGQREKLQVERIALKKFKEQPSYYINNLEGGGWVLVSADKKTGPVIAYSENGSYDTLTLPQVMKDWMAQYDTIIEKRRQLDTVFIEKEAKWKNLEKETSRLKQAYQPGEYLVKSFWDQGWPYNSQVTHSTTECGTCPAGCVCIAVSQIVNYWGFAVGNKADYEFWHMPNVLGSNQTEIIATAYMIKVIGDDKLESDYCDGGCQTSHPVTTNIFSSTPGVGDVFDNLGYYPYTMEYHDCSWYTYNGWLDLIKGEIDAKRPVYYRYIGVHSFICDGYNDSNGNLHFNMGWGSYYKDAWYDYEDLNIGGLDFTDMGKHACIVGILPDITTDKTLSTTLNSGDNKTWQVKNNMVATTVTINPGAKCQLVGGNSVSLQPGFWAKPGSSLTAKAYVKGPILGNYKSALASNNNNLVTTINKNVVETTKLTVFPNPSYGQVTLSAPLDGKGYYQLFDFNGKVLTSGTIVSKTTNIGLQNIPQGLYMLRVLYNNQYSLFQIINQK